MEYELTDKDRKAAAEIALERESSQRRQDEFRTVAGYAAEEFAKLAEVRRVVLFGSVAVPLVEYYPRSGKYRSMRASALRECGDIDLAVWVNDIGNLRALQLARNSAARRFTAEHQYGPAPHQIDVFIMDADSGRFVGNLCCFKDCPKGKPDCWVEGCGNPPHLKLYNNFKLQLSALSPTKSVVLYESEESGSPHRIERLRAVVDEILMSQPDEVERRCGFVHLYGVAQACALLAKKRGLDPELCTAAGMLHDISSYKTGDSTNHGELSAIEAERILLELGDFAGDEIEVICKAIRHHREKKEVHSDMCEALKDADVLQHHLYNTSLPVHRSHTERLPRILRELGASS